MYHQKIQTSVNPVKCAAYPAFVSLLYKHKSVRANHKLAVGCFDYFKLTPTHISTYRYITARRKR